MSPKLFPSKLFLIILIPFTLIVLFAVIYFGYMFQGRSITLLNLTEKFGYDFRDFHGAGRLFLKDMDPWSLERFVTPPLSLYVLLPLSFFPAKLAVKVFFLANILCLLLGIYFYNAIFLKDRREQLGHAVLLCTVLFSYPVYFLLQRGNVDGLVFLLISLGLLFASKPERTINDIWAALFWTLACHIKIYPIFILLPLLLAKRWRLSLFLLIGLAFFVLSTYDMWPAFVKKSLLRGSIFKLTENGSMLNTIMAFVVVLNRTILKNPSLYNIDLIKRINYFTYYSLLGVNVLIDLKSQIGRKPAPIAEMFIVYVPFMVSIPQTVFHYEYVQLLAFVPFMICLVMRTSKTDVFVYLIIFGIVLTQIHAAALYYLTGNIISYSLPGFGVLIIIISNIGLRLRPRREFMDGAVHAKALK